MQQPMPNPEDITDPTTAMNMALVLMAKAFKLKYSTPTNNNQRTSSNPHNRQIAQPVQNVGNQVVQNVVQNAVQNLGVQNVRNQNGLIIRCYNCRGLGHLARNCIVRPMRRDAAYLQTQLLIALKEEAGIQLQDEEFDLMAAIADLDEIEEVNANCILMANLQQASTSGTRLTKLPSMTQTNQLSVEQDGGTVDQHPVTIEETPPAEGNGNGINGNTIRCYNCQGEDHYVSNCTVMLRKRDAAYLQQQLQIAQEEEAEIQSTQEEFDFMAAADGSVEVHLSRNSYDNDIFIMFTQEEQYTELLEHILEPHQVPQNDSNVISKVSSVEQGGGTLEQHSVNVEETRAYHESLFHNLVAEVEKVNSVNRKMKETKVQLTTELARYKNQEKSFEISQEKFDKLERCYQKSVYQEQCLTKKINALHLSVAKQIATLNEEIANLNNQLSKEKSSVSFLQEERKKLKNDFKTREDALLDKQIQLENKIRELDNILVKTGQSIQNMHMLSPKPDSFYHTEQNMALGYQNPFYLKQAQQKQQSLYNGKVLLEKHDPPAVYDLEETLEIAQEIRLKMKQLNKEIKPANYTKINHLSGVFVSQTAKSREESYFSNTSKTANVSKSFSIPNEEFSNDTTPTNESLAKHKALELEIERLLRAVFNQDIMSIVQNPSVVDSSNLQTELEQLEFQVLNYAKDNAHLKTTYKNLFDSIKVTRAQTKAIVDSLQDKLHDMIYENAKLRTQLFDKVFEQKDTNKVYSVTPFPKSTVIPKVGKSNALSKPVTSNSAPCSRESTVVNNERVIALGIFRINPFKASRVDNFVPNKHVKASVRTKTITVSQHHVITKNDVNSKTNGFSPKDVNSTTRTRRP
ncbi:retrovirus-related pol polyprotein from transposon TNT 1-94 [Tanacetum coccineum]